MPSDRSQPQHFVHNHGTEDGPGLACREHRLPDGRLVGACMSTPPAAGGAATTTRPEWVRCIASSPIGRTALCGRALAGEWAFVDRAHAEAEVAREGRLVPCRACLTAPAAGGGGVETGWTEQDAQHLAHLAECRDPAWMGEVATRAVAHIAALRTRLADLERERDEAAQATFHFAGQRVKLVAMDHRAQGFGVSIYLDYAGMALPLGYGPDLATAMNSIPARSQYDTALAESARLAAALRRVEEGVTVYLRDVEARIADPKTFPAARAEMQGEAFAYRRILGLYTVPPQEAPDAIR